MKFYKFRTRNTIYYFPKLEREENFLYGLYSPYTCIARIYWWAFRKFSWWRGYNIVDIDDMPAESREAITLCGKDCKIAINMGSPGVEQKISILGYDTITKTPFFAKFSYKPIAQKLTENEIYVYKKLNSTGLVPDLLLTKSNTNYKFFKAEYIKGRRIDSFELNQNIINLCFDLAKHHIKNENFNGLKTSLSHGDFCPWNMLYDGKKIKLVDWELAEDRTIGYDLFTYICQCSILFNKDQELSIAINENIKWINQFFHEFDIYDWKPYLQAFCKHRQEYEKSKGLLSSSEAYHKLYISI